MTTPFTPVTDEVRQQAAQAVLDTLAGMRPALTAAIASNIALVQETPAGSTLTQELLDALVQVLNGLQYIVAAVDALTAMVGAGPAPTTTP